MKYEIGDVVSVCYMHHFETITGIGIIIDRRYYPSWENTPTYDIIISGKQGKIITLTESSIQNKI